MFTADHVPSNTDVQLNSLLIKLVKLYVIMGLIVRVVFMDIELKNGSNDLDLVQVNTKAAICHVV